MFQVIDVHITNISGLSLPRVVGRGPPKHVCVRFSFWAGNGPPDKIGMPSTWHIPKRVQMHW